MHFLPHNYHFSSSKTNFSVLERLQAKPAATMSSILCIAEPTNPSANCFQCVHTASSRQDPLQFHFLFISHLRASGTTSRRPPHLLSTPPSYLNPLSHFDNVLVFFKPVSALEWKTENFYDFTAAERLGIVEYFLFKF